MSLNIRNLGRIRHFEINRPATRNAVDPETATLLFKAFLTFERDETAEIAILSGNGGAFCSGFDLKAAAAGVSGDWLARHAIPENWTDPAAQPLPSPMGPARLMLSKPVSAAIEGPAVAGGMELALWCDIRIMAEDACFGVFCRRWGVPLIDGGTQRLPRLIGQGRANDLILTGRAVDAAEALAIGLANRVVTSGSALSAAMDYASELLRLPMACMLADRNAARPSAAILAEGLRREWQSAPMVLDQARKGAERFANGLGRGGDFSEI